MSHFGLHEAPLTRMTVIVVAAGVAFACSDATQPVAVKPATTAPVTPVPAPAPPPAAAIKLASVSAGWAHTCGLAPDGAAYCWGENAWGQLGDGTTNSRSLAMPVLGGITFAALGAGAVFNCGLSTVGTAYCWGGSYYSQLGNGTFGMERQTRPMPVAGGLTFTSIAVGTETACGLTADGAAYCWGFGWHGNLGNGASWSACHPGQAVACEVPVPVVGGLRFASLSLGNEITCGIATTGAAYCWGGNFLGELGIGNWTGPEECYDDSDISIVYYGCSDTPVAVSGNLTFTAIAAGGESVCGLRADATTFCWGGDAEVLAGAAPTGEVCSPYKLACRTTPVRLESDLRFTRLSLGAKLCGLTASGAAYCWGGNKDYPSPLGYDAIPQPLDTTLKFVTPPGGSGRHMCGVTTDGAAYCWGQNSAGQLGDGTTRDSREPVRVRAP